MEEKNFSGRFFTVACDLTNETDILNAFKWIDENIGGIHFMINNAGIIRISTILSKIIIMNLQGKNICIYHSIVCFKNQTVTRIERISDLP